MRAILFSIKALVLILVLAGCASGTFKARQEQREKVARTSGLFCEFISGDQYPDVDVELTLQMAKRCDTSQPFSVTNYRNASASYGVLYCCNTKDGEPVKTPKRVSEAAPAMSEEAPPAPPVKKTTPKAKPAPTKSELAPVLPPAAPAPAGN